MPVLTLQSSDGKIFNVDVEIARVSVTVSNMIQHTEDDMEQDVVIPLSNVNGKILEKVIEWATHHHMDDPAVEEGDGHSVRRTDDISAWDKEFLKIDQGTLFDLVLAANYLDVKGLLDLTCKAVAIMIRDKTPEEVRKILNLRNDFTAAEEEHLRKENDWLLEK